MQRRSAGVGWVLAAHGIVVAVLLLAYVVATATHHGPDANIGAGIIGLALLVLGLPWTLPILLAPAEPADGPGLWLLLRLGPAVLNVALHALLRGLIRRRRS